MQLGPDGATHDEIIRTLSAVDSCDLVVLPELCNAPYFPVVSESGWDSRATSLDSAFVGAMRAEARRRGCYILLPVHLAEGSGRLSNAAVLIGRDGELVSGQTTGGSTATVFRKVHLCDVHFYGGSFYESSYFVAGDDYLVWDTDIGKLGVLICYDRHFPEAWITLREAGAEIVAVPSTSPIGTEATFVAEMQAMALQQQVYVITTNRAGDEEVGASRHRTRYLGASCIIGPDGTVLARLRDEANTAVRAEIDLDLLDAARKGLNTAHARRPETYHL